MSKFAIAMLAVAVVMVGTTAKADMTTNGNVEIIKCQDVYKVLDNALLTPCPWSTCVEMGCPQEINIPCVELPFVLESAQLCVIADGVDGNDDVKVQMQNENGWHTLGYLDQIGDCNYILPKPGEGSWCEEYITKTCFDIDPEWLDCDGKFKMKVGGFKCLIPNQVVEIEKVCLKCSYVPIPAPGAAILGSLGLGLVNWVKKRR